MRKGINKIFEYKIAATYNSGYFTKLSTNTAKLYKFIKIDWIVVDYSDSSITQHSVLGGRMGWSLQETFGFLVYPFSGKITHFFYFF